jgi:hypothetical protein
MTREELSKASEALERAAADADGEAAAALQEQADQLASLAEADRGPDHGRLARHQSKLRDVRGTVDDDVGARIDEANDLINAHRETLEGV